MKKVFFYLKPYTVRMIFGLLIKVMGTLMDLGLPWVLAYIIDDVIPLQKTSIILWWGMVMIALSVGARTFNIIANRMAARVARNTTETLRHDLFNKIFSLSGNQLDYFTIPSLEARMTSDTYNIHNMIGMMQRIGVRAPIILVGGIIITSTLEPILTLVLVSVMPFLGLVVYIISKKGIPLYSLMQVTADKMVCVVRENITGIRVIKALSKTAYEKKRFKEVNDELVKKELKAGRTMAITNPIMNLLLNMGLTLVVAVGAYRVNSGASAPGKIVAFLSYFAIMLHAVMAINRIFVVYSRASASATRISEVLDMEEDLKVELLPEEFKQDNTNKGQVEQENINQENINQENINQENINQENVNQENVNQENVIQKNMNQENISRENGMPIKKDKNSQVDRSTSEDYIAFHHVNFSYTKEPCITDMDFTIQKGKSLGMIGSTGSGKTTLINLLMRFYDVKEGNITIDGQDIRTYDKQVLRKKFGVVFQNDVLFADKVYENISLGRELPRDRVFESAEHAQAASFIEELDDQLDFQLAIKGSNLSGGQKQRLLVARALAGKPDILILDDSSSSLDYRTDSLLRKAIRENYQQTTTIVIAQRISSVMKLDHILVVEDGSMAGYGTHEELLKTCKVYQEIYQSQFGLEEVSYAT